MYPSLIGWRELPPNTCVVAAQYGSRLVLKCYKYGESVRDVRQESFIVDDNQAIMTFSREEAERFCIEREWEKEYASELFSHKGPPPQME